MFKDERLSYSNLLLKELKFRAGGLIEFLDDYSLTLYVKEVRPSGIPAYEDYSKNVDALIEHNYPSLWERAKNREACINAHNNSAVEFLHNLVEDMRTRFKNSKNSMIERGLNAPPFDNYYIRDRLLINICYVIKHYYNEKEKSFDFNKLVVAKNKKTNMWELSIVIDFAYSKQEDMQEIKDIFREVILDYLQKPDFNKLKAYKNTKIEGEQGEHTEYLKGINELIQKIVKGIPIDSIWDSLERQLRL